MSLRQIQTAFIVLSLALHVGFFVTLRRAAEKAPRVPRAPVRFTLTKPPPPPEPVPEPVKEEPKKVDLTKKVEKKPEPAPEPPPKAKEPPPPPVFGLSMSSVAATGDSGFRVPLGNTTMGDPNQGKHENIKPLTGAGGSGKAPVSISRVSKMPVPLGDCPPGDLRALYTPEAKEAGVEGRVVLEVQIDEAGKPSQVKVQRGIGYGLDEVALRSMREKCRFAPAEVGGEKVATTIRYTFVFELED